MRRNVAILLFDDVKVLDFAGPFEVFAAADELHRHTGFPAFTVAEKPGTVRAVNGLKITPDYPLETAPAPTVLVVPGGIGTRALLQRPALLEWLRGRAARAKVVMSVCTGPLLLATAGLLEGLWVTVHHECLDLLRELAPAVTIDPARRFHDNGRILTAAGVTTGIDCALHVVERLLGADAADQTVRHLEFDRYAQPA